MSSLLDNAYRYSVISDYCKILIKSNKEFVYVRKLVCSLVQTTLKQN